MKGETLYFCPLCFKVCDTELECHAHRMLECHVGDPGDEVRKPLEDRFGQLVSRAPRWYLEAHRLIPAWSPLPEKKGANIS